MRILLIGVVSAVVSLGDSTVACNADGPAVASGPGWSLLSGTPAGSAAPSSFPSQPASVPIIVSGTRPVSVFQACSPAELFGQVSEPMRQVGTASSTRPPHAGTFRVSGDVSRPRTGRTFSGVPGPFTFSACGQSSCGDSACRPVGCGDRVTCCLPCPCDESCRNWTVRVGTILLHRESPNAGLLFSNPANPAEFVNVGGFDFDYQAGLDLSVINHRAVGDRDLEFRYFGVHEWNDRQFATLSGNPLVIHTNPPTFFSGNRSLTSVYASNLDSAEMNLWQRGAFDRQWVSLCAGLRYIRFRERLDTYMADSLAAPAAPDEAFNVGAENNLFGVQAGADVVLINRCDGCVKFHSKGGVFLNAASQSSALYHFAPPTTVFTPAQDDTDLAYVGEFGISATQRVTRCVNFRTGYHALWLNGVATAAGQYPAISTASLSGLNDDDVVFFHGATFQLELLY